MGAKTRLALLLFSLSDYVEEVGNDAGSAFYDFQDVQYAGCYENGSGERTKQQKHEIVARKTRVRGES
jgi:hypothetical protein